MVFSFYSEAPKALQSGNFIPEVTFLKLVLAMYLLPSVNASFHRESIFQSTQS
jgi:hypothetical protein